MLTFLLNLHVLYCNLLCCSQCGWNAQHVADWLYSAAEGHDCFGYAVKIRLIHFSLNLLVHWTHTDRGKHTELLSFSCPTLCYELPPFFLPTCQKLACRHKTDGNMFSCNHFDVALLESFAAKWKYKSKHHQSPLRYAPAWCFCLLFISKTEWWSTRFECDS